MYVGAWQEFALMKVIEDLRDENEKLRQVIGAGSEPAQPTVTGGTAFSSSVPTRSPRARADSPRRPSTDDARRSAKAAFQMYPPGHPLSASYRAARGPQALPEPALTSDDEAAHHERGRHRASGTSASVGSSNRVDGPTRLPFRMYWRPDAYGRYSIDNHEGANTSAQQRQLATSGTADAHSSSSHSQRAQAAGGRHCPSCDRKRDAAHHSIPSGSSTSQSASPASTAATIDAWRQRDPQAWTTQSTAYPGSQSATTSMEPPTYGPGETALLASMGLGVREGYVQTHVTSSEATAGHRRVAAGGGPSVSPRVLEHPLVQDLARRVPLDTKSLSQLAGQKVFTRCVKGTDGGEASRGAHAWTTAASSRAQRAGKTPAEEDAARQVERRLRLQALYSGMAPEAVEAYVQEACARRRGDKKPTSAQERGEAKGEGVDDADVAAAADNSVETPHRGVPWDSLPGPTTRVHTESRVGTATPHDSRLHRLANEVAAAHPAGSIANLDDLLLGDGYSVNGDDTVPREHNFTVHMQTPPAPEAIDEADVGGLVQWAENLDLDMIDAM